MQIARLPDHDEQEVVYQVEDPTTIQHVFYLSVNTETRTISVSSIGPDGTADEADTVLVASRLDVSSYEPGDESISWEYKGAADLADKLEKLIGQHSAIVLTDLGVSAAQDPNDPEWQSGMEQPENPTQLQTPDLARVTDMEVNFDPSEFPAAGPAPEDEPNAADANSFEFDPSGTGDEPPPEDGGETDDGEEEENQS